MFLGYAWFFCYFQPGVAYKGVAYSKSVWLTTIRLKLSKNRSWFRLIVEGRFPGDPVIVWLCWFHIFWGIRKLCKCLIKLIPSHKKYAYIEFFLVRIFKYLYKDLLWKSPLRIQSECRKILTRKNCVMEAFFCSEKTYQDHLEVVKK